MCACVRVKLWKIKRFTMAANTQTFDSGGFVGRTDGRARAYKKYTQRDNLTIWNEIDGRKTTLGVHVEPAWFELPSTSLLPIQPKLGIGFHGLYLSSGKSIAVALTRDNFIKKPKSNTKLSLSLPLSADIWLRLINTHLYMIFMYISYAMSYIEPYLIFIQTTNLWPISVCVKNTPQYTRCSAHSLNMKIHNERRKRKMKTTKKCCF